MGIASGLIGLLTVGCALPPPRPPPTPVARTESRKLPPVDLRGYGRVAGEFVPAGVGASRLTIQCADAGHARLTAAKYISDLQELGGVEPGRDATMWQVPGQGWVAVRQQGRKIAILTAPTKTGLDELIQQTGWQPAAPDPAAVPMFLNSWDRFGWRFYYRPWELPKDTKWADYPVLNEFDFAQRNHDAGLVFWATPSEVDDAVGLSNNNWWDWAARAAARRQLPVVINTSVGTPTWLLNRYRDQTMQLMPEFSGGSYTVMDPGHAGMRSLSWAATSAEDAELAQLQQIVREYAAQTNTVEFLEPHGELSHGEHDVFLEYGPVADQSFQKFLRRRYGSVSAVARRWGDAAGPLRRWEDVRVPELAAFLGFDGAAVDLTGDWRFQFEPAAGLLAAWTQVGFDDQSWPQVRAPGNDVFMFLEKKPAIFRRTFTVRPAQAPVWLYVWDLNYGVPEKDWVGAWVNGTKVGEDKLQHAKPHWCAFEVSQALKTGENQLTIRVPKGFLGYRVYLSTHAPVSYPNLGEGRNAQWVDFCDWRRWTRVETVRRGMEMIRQVDPDRSIICMAPDAYFSGVRELCQEYGAHFHNTGHMSGFWNDFLPMLMRGADLPFSLEPGSPAPDLPGFKEFMGRWFTEGIQAVHYFIHIGNVFWPEDIRREFERIQPLVQTIGKVHPPKAGVAMLFSDRVNALTGYPWGKDFNINLPSGYWGWRISDALADEYHVDAVTDLDFTEGGAAAGYPVIVDANTSIMDPALVRQIEAWVRRGGIFVTFIQTGRHTPEQRDAWPISELTGYRVTALDPHAPDGREGHTRSFSFVEGQSIFLPADWPTNQNQYANGQSLEKVAPECQDLLRWADGSVAAGLRPLGKGYVVNLGLKFGTGRGGGGGNNRIMVGRVLDWAKVARIPAHADGVLFRHYVSNNGLYDVWTLWNQHRDKAVVTRLVFRDGIQPAATDVLTGQPVDLRADLKLAPLETKIVLTPRGQLATAPLAWFQLQRNWWRGTKPPAKPARLPANNTVVDLTDGWAYRVLDEAGRDDPAPLAAPGVDDAAWPRRPLNCWAVPEELPSHRVLFRRQFTIPREWQHGETELWLKSFFANTVVGTARVWLDGAEIGQGANGVIQKLSVAAGTSHLLAVEVRSAGQVGGVRGNTWLAFTPAPRAQHDLAGQWTPSTDLLHSGEPMVLPGRTAGVRSLRRQFQLPADWAGGQIYLDLRGGYAISGALINGRYIRRHQHALGETTFLNITPLLHGNATNEIEIILGGGRDDHIDAVHLCLYDDQHQP